MKNKKRHGNKRITLHYGPISWRERTNLEFNDIHVGRMTWETKYGLLLEIKKVLSPKGVIHLYLGDIEKNLDMVMCKIKTYDSMGIRRRNLFLHESEYIEGKKCIYDGYEIYLGEVLEKGTLEHFLPTPEDRIPRGPINLTCVI